MVRSPVAKPLEQCSAVIHLGPDWSPFSASGREGSLREAEADCRAPQLRLVVDRSPEGAMPTPSQQVHPDAERSVGDDLSRSAGAPGERILDPNSPVSLMPSWHAPGVLPFWRRWSPAVKRHFRRIIPTGSLAPCSACSATSSKSTLPASCERRSRFGGCSSAIRCRQRRLRPVALPCDLPLAGARSRVGGGAGGEDHSPETIAIDGAEAYVWTPDGVKAMTPRRPLYGRVQCVAIGSVEPVGLRQVGDLLCDGVCSHGGGSGGDEPANCGQAHVLRCGVGGDAGGDAD